MICSKFRSFEKFIIESDGYDFVFRFSDGKLDIVGPSFVHYLEVLEGSDGDKMPGINDL